MWAGGRGGDLAAAARPALAPVNQSINQPADFYLYLFVKQHRL
jgi:hypothetical protein